MKGKVDEEIKNKISIILGLVDQFKYIWPYEVNSMLSKIIYTSKLKKFRK